MMQVPCMHCGVSFDSAFKTLDGISIDNKIHYYLCPECNKEWSEYRARHIQDIIQDIYNQYHDGKIPYSAYQKTFNKLMDEWLLSMPVKVELT